MSLVKEELLTDLQARLATRMPQVLYEQWFADAEIMSWENAVLELGVKNRFFKSWIETKYMRVLMDAAAEVAGHEMRVTVSVSPRLFTPFREEQEKDRAAAEALGAEAVPMLPPPASRPRRPAGLELNPDLTFDRFVVGPSNRLSHAVAMRAVESPGEYGRIYFCGQHGVGKTHLLQAICHETRRLRPEASVVYVTCEKLVSDFTAAHASGKVKDFRAAYRDCDVLAVDQLQALGQGSKVATQAELLAVIDLLEARGRQMVFGSTLAPDELEGVDARLRDRLGAGFVDRLALPDEGTRREIIVGKLREKGVVLPEAALALMARELSGNVRRLEGTISRLAALIEMEGMEPNVSCIRLALDVSTPGAKRSPLTCRDIIGAVAEEYGLSGEAVVGRGRAAVPRRARQTALVLCRRLLGSRYAELGEVFGGRSHATVLSAIRKAPGELFGAGIAGRPVERILFRLGVNMHPEDLIERQRGLFE